MTDAELLLRAAQEFERMCDAAVEHEDRETLVEIGAWPVRLRALAETLGRVTPEIIAQVEAYLPTLDCPCGSEECAEENRGTMSDKPNEIPQWAIEIDQAYDRQYRPDLRPWPGETPPEHHAPAAGAGEAKQYTRDLREIAREVPGVAWNQHELQHTIAGCADEIDKLRAALSASLTPTPPRDDAHATKTDICEGCYGTFPLAELHQSPPETGDGLMYCSKCVGPKDPAPSRDDAGVEEIDLSDAMQSLQIGAEHDGNQLIPLRPGECRALLAALTAPRETPMHVWFVTAYEYGEAVEWVVCATETRAAQEERRVREERASSPRRWEVTVEREEVLL